MNAIYSRLELGQRLNPIPSTSLGSYMETQQLRCRIDTKICRCRDGYGFVDSVKLMILGSFDMHVIAFDIVNQYLVMTLSIH